MFSLAGRRIVITRASHQYGELADLLCREGAEPLPYPAISIAPPEDTRALDEALLAASAGAFDWLIFTSANTASIVASRLCALQRRATLKVAIAVVGNGTAQAVRCALGLRADFVPQGADALSLSDTLPLHPGARVLLPQSEAADETLNAALAERGAKVTAINAYRVVQGEGGVDLPRLLPQIDAITFTSGSTVDYFVRRFTDEGGHLDALNRVNLAYMGASARRALAVHSLTPAASARQNALDSLVQALKDTFNAR
jgi:uroporphyrinogen-III synthase